MEQNKVAAASGSNWLDELANDQPVNTHDPENGFTDSGSSPPRNNESDHDPYPAIPAELKSLAQWFVFRREVPTGRTEPQNIPYSPRVHKTVDVTDPANWSSYRTAISALSQYDGLSLAIAPPYIGIDLDECRNPATGEIEPWALAIITEVASYTEVSPSRTGIRIIAKGEIPENVHRGRFEMYRDKKVLTITGEHLKGTPSGMEPREIHPLWARSDAIDPARAMKVQTAKSPKTITLSEWLGQPLYSEAKFLHLMDGDWEGLYHSQSEADFELCRILAIKHNSDPEEIDEEFRTSGLYREKWERDSYREKTIRNAILAVPEVIDDPVDTVPLPVPDDFDDTAPLPVPDSLPLTVADPKWRGLFKTRQEMDLGPMRFLIEDFLPEGITFIGALSGSGKTWFALSMAKALSTGQKFLKNFTVPEPTPVLYLTPEAGERAFRSRLVTMGIPDDDRFLCRTMNEGPLKLHDPLLLEAVRQLKPVIFLDTVIRFSEAESENNASENQKGLVADIFGLMRAGARGVVCLHHSIKSSREKAVPTLESALRGTGDLGAMADAVYSLQVQNPEALRIRVTCVKPRDFEPVPPFEIAGRPFINEIADFAILDEPRQPPEKAEASEFAKFVEANPTATYDEIATALRVAKGRVKRIAKKAGWTKTSGKWVKIEI